MNSMKDKIDMILHEIKMEINGNNMRVQELNGINKGLIKTRDALEKVIADETRSKVCADEVPDEEFGGRR
jgi:hypothetical protein